MAPSGEHPFWERSPETDPAKLEVLTQGDLRVGLRKLLRQLDILQTRVLQDLERERLFGFLRQAGPPPKILLRKLRPDLKIPAIAEPRFLEARPDPSFEEQLLITDTLVLDLETYYTTAHDVLKLIVRLLPTGQRKRFRREEAYKNICAIRSHLIRHAYDKSQGDPYRGFAYRSEAGPILKAGSPYGKHRDPGYFSNQRSLMDLLKKYRVAFLIGEADPESADGEPSDPS